MFDPLLFGEQLPLRARFYPMGFPLDVETNSTLVLEAACRSWSSDAQTFDRQPISLQVAVGAGPEGPAAIPAFRGLGHLLSVISDRHNFAVTDYTRSFAFCRLTEAVARDRDWARYYFLDAVVYTLLTQLYLTPIHAACVARRGSGVMLCGDSGAGKSCLSYGCARRGWTYVSDDASCLVRGDGTTLLGRRNLIRFRETAATLFPELADRKAVPGMNGDPAVEVDTRGLPGIRTAARCRAAYVVFLHRTGTPARLEPLSPAAALERLGESLAFYGPEIYEEQKDSLRNLLTAGDGPRAFDLTYRDLDQAIDQLEELVDRGGQK